jgi:cytochrome c-type biogenesis protein
MLEISNIGVLTVFAAGVISFLSVGALIVMGLAMIAGQISAFSYWLLDAFPPLANIG